MTLEEKDIKRNDAVLLEKYLDGDEDSFVALIRRYERQLYNYLANYLGNQADADDVFQETFVQIHKSAGAFDTSRPFKPWLYTIATNKARDAMRRDRQTAVSLDSPISSDEEDSYVGMINGNIPSPEKICMNQELVLSVRKIVGQLPEKFRVVLLLCYFNELTNRQASEIAGVPEGTIKSRLYTAVRMFANRWQKLTDVED